MDCSSFGVGLPSDGSGHLEHSSYKTPITQTHTNFPVLTSGYKDNGWKTTPSSQLKTCVLEPASYLLPSQEPGAPSIEKFMRQK